MLKGFKDFLTRGNVVDLAVAVVIGAAFGAVVSGLLKGLINPLFAAVAGKPDLDQVGTFKVHGADFSIGLFLTPLINFLIIGSAIYFIVVLPLNTLAERRARGVESETEAPSEEVALLTEIRDSLRARS
jgi:large conductance mechanosensitive channel